MTRVPPSSAVVPNEQARRVDAELMAPEGPSGQYTVGSVHVGPIPSPEQLKAYDEAHPGLANTIVEMAKGEQAHRHSIDQQGASLTRFAVRGDVAHQILGQLLTAILALATLAAAVYLAPTAPWVAGAVMGSSVVVAAIARFKAKAGKEEKGPASPEED